MEIDDSILIIDIETSGSIDATQAVLKWFGSYSYLTNKYSYASYKQIDFIKNLIKEHRVICGFNIKNFDNEILKKYGVNFDNKILIDLWEILAPKSSGGKGRHVVMNVKFPDNKLGTIVKVLKLGREKKEDFNYLILDKNEWSRAETQYILDYLKTDIFITKDLFEYIYNYFLPFKEFLGEQDQLNYKWLTTTIGVFAYKVICKEAGLREEYSDDKEDEDEHIEGGFVLLPKKEKELDNVYSFDFASLYPHIFFSNNLYSSNCKCCKDGEKYKGNDLFKLKGKYCSKEMGIIERTIKKLYLKRLELKQKKDSRQYPLKIMINVLYGVSLKKAFKHLYNPTIGADCTYIGRTCIKYVISTLEKEGYIVLASDTDSVFIKDSFNDFEKLNKLMKDVSSFLRQNMLFPQETFGLVLENKIKAMFFFKSGNEFIKKNYIYITTGNKMIIKGLPIIKGNVSKISLHIFDNFLRNQIMETLNVKFNKNYILNLIYNELEKNIELGSQDFKVREYDYYISQSKISAEKNKKDYNIPTGIQAQISKKYDSGTHRLIPNNKFGIGKDKKYCTIEEFKKLKLKVRNIDIEKALSELEPFIKDSQAKLEF